MSSSTERVKKYRAKQKAEREKRFKEVTGSHAYIQSLVDRLFAWMDRKGLHYSYTCTTNVVELFLGGKIYSFDLNKQSLDSIKEHISKLIGEE